MPPLSPLYLPYVSLISPYLPPGKARLALEREVAAKVTDKLSAYPDAYPYPCPYPYPHPYAKVTDKVSAKLMVDDEAERLSGDLWCGEPYH